MYVVGYYDGWCNKCQVNIDSIDVWADIMVVIRCAPEAQSTSMTTCFIAILAVCEQDYIVQMSLLRQLIKGLHHLEYHRRAYRSSVVPD